MFLIAWQIGYNYGVKITEKYERTEVQAKKSIDITRFSILGWKGKLTPAEQKEIREKTKGVGL